MSKTVLDENTTILLNRFYNDIDDFMPNRLSGQLIIIQGKNIYTIPTMENRDFALHEGQFTLRYEYSPKFGKKLWEFYGTIPRREVKFHNGKYPEHSKGCPLLNERGLNIFHNILDSQFHYNINVQNFK